MMDLVINGEDYKDVPSSLSVAGLLVYLKLPEGKIAVELNREIVSKSCYKTVELKTGDTLEIIHFIGGG